MRTATHALIPLLVALAVPTFARAENDGEVLCTGNIEDVARAFAWTHKNISSYGGRADQIYVTGQSAGGHLAALLATNERYLKAEKLSLKDIKGVMPMSGVYVFRGGRMERVLGKGQD